MRGLLNEECVRFAKCVPLRDITTMAISHAGVTSDRAAASDRRDFSLRIFHFVAAPRGQKEFYINKSLGK